MLKLMLSVVAIAVLTSSEGTAAPRQGSSDPPAEEPAPVSLERWMSGRTGARPWQREHDSLLLETHADCATWRALSAGEPARQALMLVAAWINVQTLLCPWQTDLATALFRRNPECDRLLARHGWWMD